MFWNDIKEIKEWMLTISLRLTELETKKMKYEDCYDDFEESIERIHDKLNKTIDKFDDYMKNVDKLNSMINEFKGCVSMARAALHEKKEQKKP